MRRAGPAWALCTALSLGIGATARAQVPTRPDTTRRDSTSRAPVPQPPVAQPAGAQPPRDTTARPARRRSPGVQPVRPPLSPRRALIYSLLLPGLGQSRLDRGATGAVFVAIEAGALAMVGKSAYDLAQAKAFRGDSLIATAFPVDTAGNPVTPAGAQLTANVFNGTLVRSRRLHLEDWLAVIAFNHLFAGAEAFVSANLWDVPGEVSVLPGPRRTSVGLTLSW